MSGLPLKGVTPPPVPHLDRRRLLGLIAGGALVAGLQPPASSAQSATPSADQLENLQSLSRTLCGGGTFAQAQVAQLAGLLATDAHLMAGVEDLVRDGTDTPTPDSRSPAAQAAAEAVLLFWYTGEFKGEPIPNHEDVYIQLQAWQAMYTPAWTVCKVYGEWANPPTMTPQEPENA